MSVPRLAERQISLPVADGDAVAGDLSVPAGSAGIVIFAHGSGSSRKSSRNRGVAATLQASGFATLLFDVLTDPDLAALPLGLFGASTGAAAALVAAAGDDAVRAIVSRGGRPDLARDALERVTAPTLLIVGSLDTPVVGMNRTAFERLGSKDKELVIVAGATHLFEEPGKIEEVARLAAD